MTIDELTEGWTPKNKARHRACQQRVKNRVSVWPSAYASAQVVQCYYGRKGKKIKEEIRSDRETILDLADRYVNKYGRVKNVTGYGVSLSQLVNNPLYVKGQCYAVANDFVRWAKANYPETKCSVISGETPESSTEEPSFHFAVKVNGKYVLDLTHKQFHPDNEAIHLYSLSEFRKEFPQIDKGRKS